MKNVEIMENSHKFDHPRRWQAKETLGKLAQLKNRKYKWSQDKIRVYKDIKSYTEQGEKLPLSKTSALSDAYPLGPLQQKFPRIGR